MPINSKHPQLSEYGEIYEFLEDFYDGEQAVKKKATKYVPRLSGQSIGKFRDYVNRGMFYSAFSKTIDALTGSTFSVPPALNLPPKIEYLKDDATGKGTSLTELAIALCIEALKTGRVGLFVDRPTDGGKPYFVMFDCDDITNWRDNQFIILKNEQLVPKEDDPYEFKEVDGYRELTIVDGKYVVNIWSKTDRTNNFAITETIVPEKFGKPLDYIPFTFIGPNGLDSNIGRPPLLDLANVQRTLFAVNCDYANGLHVSCIPTPYITGLNNDSGSFELKVGSDSCIILPEPTSKVGYLEFQGQGLEPVRQYIDKLELTMAALGARVAEQKNNKTLIETATGSRIREALSVSTLGAILATVESALNKCCKWAAEWEGADANEVSITLNKELISANIDANMVTALMQAVQNGLISQETFYKKLSDAGLTEPGVSAQQDLDRIKVSPIADTQTVPTNPQGIDKQQNL